LRPIRFPDRALRVLVAAGVAMSVAAPASAVTRHERVRRGHCHTVKSWYVAATASPAGNGSRGAPFASLAAAQAASAAGDRIVILPSPARAAPLDGGIALKPRQTLVGAGAPVAGRGLDVAPRIENTHKADHSGDAVVLADRATVRNLVIGPSYRGAVYGSDVTGVTVTGNDVWRQNTSCTVGFVVLPFVLPTIVPGAGVPIDGLNNGWAGIMVDESRVAGTVAIEGNVVHDADCGDGIDVRLTGIARIQARITRNLVTRLKQGERLQSLLAIGMQTQGHSELVADLDRNTETDVGSAGADSEGVFANLAGSSRLTADVDHNTWHHGIGGFSVNGMEMVITSGNPTATMRIADSTFSDGPGDLLEEINFGTNAAMSLELDRVAASHSTGLGNTYVIPGNNGDCLVAGETGAGDSLSLRMRDTKLTGCINNGLTIASGVSNGSRGPVQSLGFDIDHSAITDNRAYNLRVMTETDLTRLSGKVQNTDLRGARQIDVALDQLGGRTATATLDLGGGSLGSVGHNCISGAGLLDAETLGYEADMQANWWGKAGGPALGRTVAAAGQLRTDRALTSRPVAVC
jgi:hypothetical protein